MPATQRYEKILMSGGGAMRVWIIQDGEPLRGIDPGARDWRCGLLSKALAARRHAVFWWASTFDHSRRMHRFDAARTVEIMPGVNIRLLHGPGYRRNKSPQRWRHHRVLARAFASEAAASARPDIVFASLPTPELAEQAVLYGRRRGVPVLVDVRDLWPDHYLTLVPPPFRGLFRLGLSSEYRRVRRLFAAATGITAISQTYLNWALRHGGRPQRAADGVFFMGYPSPAFAPEEVAARQVSLAVQYGLAPEDFLVAFVGAFISSYALPTVIRAARSLQQAGHRGVRFVLVGDGDDCRRLRRLARGLDNVTFTGWFDQLSIHAMLNMAAVGLAPYRDDATMSLPNKPFEYMAAGLPLLSSLRGELETLIRDERIGLQYKADDANALAERILRLKADPGERLAMGRRARQVFEARFSAEIVYPALVRHLEQTAAV